MAALMFTIALLIISIIFAVQNAGDVAVKFIFWEWQWPLALIILLFFAIGLVVGLLAIVPRLIRNRRTVSKERQKAMAEQKKSQTKPQTISDS